MSLKNTTPSCAFLCFLNFNNNLFFPFLSWIILTVPKRLLCINNSLSFMLKIGRVSFYADGYKIRFKLHFDYRWYFNVIWQWWRFDENGDTFKWLLPLIDLSSLVREDFPIFKLAWAHGPWLSFVNN